MAQSSALRRWNSEVRALYQDPDKSLKRAAPVPIDDDSDDEDGEDSATIEKEKTMRDILRAEDVKVRIDENSNETMVVDPADFRLTKEKNDDDGVVQFIPPKFDVKLAELPPGWEIVREDPVTGERIYLNREAGLVVDKFPALLYDNPVILNRTKLGTEPQVQDEYTPELIEKAEMEAEEERSRLLVKQSKLDYDIMAKRDFVRSVQAELKELEEELTDVTHNINRIRSETPQERISRERRLEEIKRNQTRGSRSRSELEEMGIFGAGEAESKPRPIVDLFPND
eukprot:CAMPEP_0167753714 /NCGR_PEP_ID=MMETSP0110_2-20121227/7870_1 /TAXON_ID=629695 /ORGANISM="Gymnochlora sp., Strain CCMP2014" /LENGTH=283 /DNA_ID=CAMNT_0007639517 /DNA_START=115 /DNA_END=966 /DNA_ORIENTATION=+